MLGKLSTGSTRNQKHSQSKSKNINAKGIKGFQSSTTAMEIPPTPRQTTISTAPSSLKSGNGTTAQNTYVQSSFIEAANVTMHSGSEDETGAWERRSTASGVRERNRGNIGTNEILSQWRKERQEKEDKRKQEQTIDKFRNNFEASTTRDVNKTTNSPLHRQGQKQVSYDAEGDHIHNIDIFHTITDDNMSMPASTQNKNMPPPPNKRLIRRPAHQQLNHQVHNEINIHHSTHQNDTLSTLQPKHLSSSDSEKNNQNHNKHKPLHEEQEYDDTTDEQSSQFYGTSEDNESGGEGLRCSSQSVKTSPTGNTALNSVGIKRFFHRSSHGVEPDGDGSMVAARLFMNQSYGDDYGQTQSAHVVNSWNKKGQISRDFLADDRNGDYFVKAKTGINKGLPSDHVGTVGNSPDVSLITQDTDLHFLRFAEADTTDVGIPPESDSGVVKGHCITVSGISSVIDLPNTEPLHYNKELPILPPPQAPISSGDINLQNLQSNIRNDKKMAPPPVSSTSPSESSRSGVLSKTQSYSKQKDLTKLLSSLQSSLDQCRTVRSKQEQELAYKKQVISNLSCDVAKLTSEREEYTAMVWEKLVWVVNQLEELQGLGVVCSDDKTQVSDEKGKKFTKVERKREKGETNLFIEISHLLTKELPQMLQKSKFKISAENEELSNLQSEIKIIKKQQENMENQYKERWNAEHQSWENRLKKVKNNVEIEEQELESVQRQLLSEQTKLEQTLSSLKEVEERVVEGECTAKRFEEENERKRMELTGMEKICEERVKTAHQLERDAQKKMQEAKEHWNEAKIFEKEVVQKLDVVKSMEEALRSEREDLESELISLDERYAKLEKEQQSVRERFLSLDVERFKLNELEDSHKMRMHELELKRKEVQTVQNQLLEIEADQMKKKECLVTLEKDLKRKEKKLQQRERDFIVSETKIADEQGKIDLKQIELKQRSDQLDQELIELDKNKISLNQAQTNLENESKNFQAQLFAMKKKESEFVRDLKELENKKKEFNETMKFSKDDIHMQKEGLRLLEKELRIKEKDLLEQSKSGTEREEDILRRLEDLKVQKDNMTKTRINFDQTMEEEKKKLATSLEEVIAKRVAEEKVLKDLLHKQEEASKEHDRLQKVVAEKLNESKRVEEKAQRLRKEVSNLESAKKDALYALSVKESTLSKTISRIESEKEDWEHICQQKEDNLNKYLSQRKKAVEDEMTTLREKTKLDMIQMNKDLSDKQAKVSNEILSRARQIDSLHSKLTSFIKQMRIEINEEKLERKKHQTQILNVRKEVSDGELSLKLAQEKIRKLEQKLQEKEVTMRRTHQQEKEKRQKLIDENVILQKKLNDEVLEMRSAQVRISELEHLVKEKETMLVKAIDQEKFVAEKYSNEKNVLQKETKTALIALKSAKEEIQKYENKLREQESLMKSSIREEKDNNSRLADKNTALKEELDGVLATLKSGKERENNLRSQLKEREALMATFQSENTKKLQSLHENHLKEHKLAKEEISTLSETLKKEQQSSTDQERNFLLTKERLEINVTNHLNKIKHLETIIDQLKNDHHKEKQLELHANKKNLAALGEKDAEIARLKIEREKIVTDLHQTKIDMSKTNMSLCRLEDEKTSLSTENEKLKQKFLKVREEHQAELNESKSKQDDINKQLKQQNFDLQEKYQKALHSINSLKEDFSIKEGALDEDRKRYAEQLASLNKQVNEMKNFEKKLQHMENKLKGEKKELSIQEEALLRDKDRFLEQLESYKQTEEASKKQISISAKEREKEKSQVKNQLRNISAEKKELNDFKNEMDKVAAKLKAYEKKLMDDNRNYQKSILTMQEKLAVEKENIEKEKMKVSSGFDSIRKIEDDIKRRASELTKKEEVFASEGEKMFESERRLKKEKEKLSRRIKDVDRKEEELNHKWRDVEKKLSETINTESKLNKFAHELKRQENEFKVKERDLRNREKAWKDNQIKVSCKDASHDEIEKLCESEQKSCKNMSKRNRKERKDFDGEDEVLLKLQQNPLQLNDKNINDNPSHHDHSLLFSELDETETQARLRLLALQLKQKDDDLTRDRQQLEEKFAQCDECENRLLEWQKELEHMAETLGTTELEKGTNVKSPASN